MSADKSIDERLRCCSAAVLVPSIVHDYSWEEIVTLTSNICPFMDYRRLLDIDEGLITKYAKTKDKLIKDFSVEGRI